LQNVEGIVSPKKIVAPSIENSKHSSLNNILKRLWASGVSLIIILIVGLFLLNNQSNSTDLTNFNANIGSSSSINPLDQVSSANIALAVATITNLPEATSISNQAETQNAEVAMASTATNIISKPQITTTSLKSRYDIFSYIVQNGDTVDSLAQKFGITSNSIMWSNNLNSNQLIPGQKLEIPPMNGIVYTVQSGDTIASLAQKYNVSQSQLIAYNDAEINGIHVGEKLLIPNGTIQAATPVSYSWSGPSYGYNGYDYGYCTWYVASVISVPDNWGNASSWAYYAAQSGWNVSSNPRIGAIAQTPYAAGGQGHVAIVQAVSANGSEVLIKDMNGLAGWDHVGEGWVPTSTFPNYIYH
jgi:LysM repeat protein